jgi:predicted RNA methylase
MSAKRSADFRLAEAIRDKGFFPSERDIAQLAALLGEDEETADLADRALGKLGAVIIETVLAIAPASDKQRARVIRLVARIAADDDQDARDVILRELAASSPIVRRASARALGRLLPEGVEAALSAALERESDASARRAIEEALGRARTIAERISSRAEEAAIDPARVPAEATLVAARCREGLEPILSDELTDLGATLETRGAIAPAARVLVRLENKPLASILTARTMLSPSFPLAPVAIDPAHDDGLARAVAEAITSPAATAILDRFSKGPVRYRLAWLDGGKRRATIAQVVDRVRAVRPAFVNDPSDRSWEIAIAIEEGSGGERAVVELVPHLDDRRFAYRRADVAAASHPTIAAAIARLGGARPDDIVWDPFTGSGLELCERAMLGPYRAMYGSDLAAGAIEAARRNLEAAGAKATLFIGEATMARPAQRPTLILSNPPLGRRVHRNADLDQVLAKFVAHAAGLLEPGGRFVWISPFAMLTARAGRDAGLSLSMERAVDLGGFTATLQAFRKPAARATDGDDDAPGRDDDASRVDSTRERSPKKRLR